MTSTMMFRFTLAIPLVFLCGCFSYVQAPVQSVPVGQDVRVYLTREGIAELRDMAESNQPFVRGRLVRREEQQLLVSIPVARQQTGFYSKPIGQEVVIPTLEIVQLERRKLNRAGTGLLVAGTAAATGVLIYTIIDAGRGPGPIGPPGPDEFRRPLFSIPIR
jgi:hypothetical protein